MKLRISSFIVLASVALWGGAGNAAPRQVWRDLNHDGARQPYEDPSLSDDARADDLLGRMTVEEKIGTMMHGSLPAQGAAGRLGWGSVYDLEAIRAKVANGVSSFITRLSTTPAELAAQNNAVQTIAAQGRLGIPLTISTDPRHHFQQVAGASSSAQGFSQWPEFLGFGALNDEDRVEQFAAIAAHEYRAVGIHMALSPQADLYTEPRWSRGVGTFGSDPARVSRMVGAYVRGFQGSAEGLSRQGVATVVKHWAGYGAEPEGFDGHNFYGRFAALDNALFATHVSAFNGAFAARVAGVMPTYSILHGVTFNDKPLPHVGAGYNSILLQDILRKQEGFTGIVISDWAITNDCPVQCHAPTADMKQGFAIGMPWGVEPLSQEERYALGVNAGIDQFGGVDDPAALLAAVRHGRVSMARIDEAARRALLLKFRLGLFDNPFVDAKRAAKLVGSAESSKLAQQTQGEAQVLLTNKAKLLPLAAQERKVWLYGVDAAAAARAGLIVVDKPEAADLAIVRLAAPFEVLHPNHFFGAMQHEGSLAFPADSPGRQAFERASARVPTILAVDLDRPAILTDFADNAGAILGLFGASDTALLQVVTGKISPRGHLPFELPRSTEAVLAQHPGRPDDSANPLFPFGHGLSY